MENQYYTQDIKIIVERDSEAFQRIEALAEKTGKPVEELLDWAVGLGIEAHLSKTVGVLERIHEVQK